MDNEFKMFTVMQTFEARAYQMSSTMFSIKMNFYMQSLSEALSPMYDYHRVFLNYLWTSL